MGKIKSAFEIAMEKAESIAIDENKLREKEEENKIKRIAGEYLASDKRDDSLLKGLSGFDSKMIRESLKSLIISSLSLPTYEVSDDRYERLKTLFSVAVGNDSEKTGYYDQVLAFLKQYPVHRKQLLEQLEAQLKPLLDQKSEAMSKQLGREVHLSIEDDKETLEIIEQNIERLEKQYNENLKEAKDTISSFF